MGKATVEMDNLLSALSGGDWRSIGRVAEVIAAVLADQSLFPALSQ